MNESKRLACVQETVRSDDVPRSSGSEHVARTMHGASLSSRRNRRNDWSTEDLRLLRELAAMGTPLKAIAAALRRTASGIRNKACMHGISLARRDATP